MNNLITSTLILSPCSLVSQDGIEFGLASTPSGPRLAVLASPESSAMGAFKGENTDLSGQTLILGPLSPHNAAALRAQLRWLQPRLLGLRTSAGMGDRSAWPRPGMYAPSVLYTG